VFIWNDDVPPGLLKPFLPIPLLSYPSSFGFLSVIILITVGFCELILISSYHELPQVGQSSGPPGLPWLCNTGKLEFQTLVTLRSCCWILLLWQNWLSWFTIQEFQMWFILIPKQYGYFSLYKDPKMLYVLACLTCPRNFIFPLCRWGYWKNCFMWKSEDQLQYSDTGNALYKISFWSTTSVSVKVMDIYLHFGE